MSHRDMSRSDESSFRKHTTRQDTWLKVASWPPNLERRYPDGGGTLPPTQYGMSHTDES